MDRHYIHKRIEELREEWKTATPGYKKYIEAGVELLKKSLNRIELEEEQI